MPTPAKKTASQQPKPRPKKLAPAQKKLLPGSPVSPLGKQVLSDARMAVAKNAKKTR